MSERFEIQRNVTADGKPFKAGDVVNREDVPASCFDSMLRVGHMKPYAEPSDAAQPLASPEKAGDEKKDAPEAATGEPEKKKRGRPKKAKADGDPPASDPEPAGNEGDPEPAAEPNDQPEPDPAIPAAI